MSIEDRPLFTVGSLVRVAAVNPPGHRRTPFYIRGKVGVVERDCGRHRNPEELGYGWSGTPLKRLYRVRFKQSEVWANYSGRESDTIDIDIYEHWLGPVPSTHV